MFFPTFTSKLIVILLAWPSIKPGPSCLSKTKRWSTQTHIFKNNNAIENILTETGVICRQSCQHLIRTAPRVCRDTWHPQTRNLRFIGSQRTLGENIWEKKNWVSRNDHVSPMRNWQKDTKTTKINHQRYKRKEHACPTVFCAVPKSAGSGRVRLSPWTFASSGDSLDRHSYIGLAPSTFLPALLAFVCKLSTK